MSEATSDTAARLASPIPDTIHTPDQLRIDLDANSPALIVGHLALGEGPALPPPPEMLVPAFGIGNDPGQNDEHQLLALSNASRTGSSSSAPRAPCH